MLKLHKIMAFFMLAVKSTALYFHLQVITSIDY